MILRRLVPPGTPIGTPATRFGKGLMASPFVTWDPEARVLRVSRPGHAALRYDWGALADAAERGLEVCPRNVPLGPPRRPRLLNPPPSP